MSSPSKITPFRFAPVIPPIYSLGPYNPDWAIVKQPPGEPHKLYLVRETKGSTREDQLRASEANKIHCGKAHFNALGVDFKPISTPGEV